MWVCNRDALLVNVIGKKENLFSMPSDYRLGEGTPILDAADLTVCSLSAGWTLKVNCWLGVSDVYATAPLRKGVFPAVIFTFFTGIFEIIMFCLLTRNFPKVFL